METLYQKRYRHRRAIKKHNFAIAECQANKVFLLSLPEDPLRDRRIKENESKRIRSEENIIHHENSLRELKPLDTISPIPPKAFLVLLSRTLKNISPTNMDNWDIKQNTATMKLSQLRYFLNYQRQSYGYFTDFTGTEVIDIRKALSKLSNVMQYVQDNHISFNGWTITHSETSNNGRVFHLKKTDIPSTPTDTTPEELF